MDEGRAARLDRFFTSGDDWEDVRMRLESVLDSVGDQEELPPVIDVTGVPVDGVPAEDLEAVVAYYRRRGLVS